MFCKGGKLNLVRWLKDLRRNRAQIPEVNRSTMRSWREKSSQWKTIVQGNPLFGIGTFIARLQDCNALLFVSNGKFAFFIRSMAVLNNDKELHMARFVRECC